jgi:hypothetical protein
MTSLEEEFKKILGDKYTQIHKFENQYKNPFLYPNDRDGTLFDKMDFQNSLLVKESSTVSSDSLNVHTNHMEYTNLYKNQVSNIQTNIDLKHDIKNLLEKVDKIIEYIENSNKQIDEKIKKYINDFSIKRDDSKGY